MNLSSLKNLSFRSKLSIVTVIALVFGIFGAVAISRQQQEIRSRAATDITGNYQGNLIGDDYRVSGTVLGNIIGNRNQVSQGVQGGIYGSDNAIVGNVGGCINGNNNRIYGNVAGGVVGTNNIVTGTKGTGDCPVSGGSTPVPPVTPTPTPTPGGISTQGSTWYTDNTKSKQGPSGTQITVHAIEAAGSTAYQLVAGTSGPTGVPCAANTVVLNQATVTSSSTGTIPATSGVAGATSGTWQICFRAVSGQTVTAPVTFTITINNQSTTPTPGTGGTGNCATVNASSGEDLVDDDCTIRSGFNGSIRGSRNTIMGGLGGAIGNIFGDSNLIQGGMNGTITGNSNEICGDLGGSINGNNNIIHGTLFRGGTDNGTGNLILPGTPCGYRPPTITPTPPGGTCADGIDNNQNELIDAGDPVCHTDGNQNNPGSYDRTRNEVIVPTATPTPTIPPSNTSISINLLLHGLGKGGDSANPGSGGNPNPKRPQRTVTVEVYDIQNQLVLTKTGGVNFNPSAGNFTGTVDLGTTLQSASYSIKVKTTQFLRALVPGIQSITQGTLNQLPQATLVNGDIDSNNQLNILDYNILIGCYSDFLPPVSCSTANKPLADLDDDGDVNQFDYNLFLRELTNRQGQ